jgi:nicotinamidase-related amidase
MKNDNPNELTLENSVLVLIDHQPAVAVNVHSIDLGLLVNNVAALARVAKALGVPTVLTTVGAEGSVLVDPLFKEITEAFPDNAGRELTLPRCRYRERRKTMSAMNTSTHLGFAGLQC